MTHGFSFDFNQAYARILHVRIECKIFTKKKKREETRAGFREFQAQCRPGNQISICGIWYFRFLNGRVVLYHDIQNVQMSPKFLEDSWTSEKQNRKNYIVLLHECSTRGEIRNVQKFSISKSEILCLFLRYRCQRERYYYAEPYSNVTLTV